MSRVVPERHFGPGLGLVEVGALVARGERILGETSGRTWWIVAAGALVVGGAAAGLHNPISGAWFWHVANGALVRRDGLGGSARYLARAGSPLDLRSWLFDLGLFQLYREWGLAALAIAGAVAGAAIGLLLLVAMRRPRRTHPLLLMGVGGLGLAALAPLLGDPSAALLALLGVALLIALSCAGRSRWGVAATVAVVLVWTNAQADAGVAVLVIWGWIAVSNWDRSRVGGGAPPTWWLIPLTGLAAIASPKVAGAVLELPLSLGMQGEHPLLAAWSSIGFHPWSARVAEIAAVLLLFAYWQAGARLHRADAYLGLITAALALLWANYLPWFLVVATVQSCQYLSLAWLPGGPSGGGGTAPAPGWPWSRPAAALPLLAVVALALSISVATVRGAGPAGRVQAQLPVRAAGWLASHPAPGAWFTTPAFGDYLATRFPAGGHLLCVDDPLPLAGSGLAACEALTVLNAGALSNLDRLRAELAVLPRSAPATSFLLAEGWRIRYRDPTTVVLAPRRL